MAQKPQKLPPEIWNNVFGYLSAAEKFNVRATCKFFKTIVDHRSLWKDWTVVLDFKNGSYNKKFWDTLRHRHVSSVVVKSTKMKHWKQLALFLPILTTVVMDQSSQECFSCLTGFPNMRRLVLRNNSSDLLLDISRFPLFLPERLTYLSMCGVMFPTTSDSPLKTWQPLRCRCQIFTTSMWTPGPRIWELTLLISHGCFRSSKVSKSVTSTYQREISWSFVTCKT
ncbi:uncharacterized protein LOC115780696 isoform X3 [Archocentrus centrarchus]|uniref:uncharacterized protein LOC115780696 isoform X3 n=1 Tax=Archocentrus centrarchus TaxID=63155 RepID=UPI0011E9DB79|nr:uncharacterized protein LOC115780696 isoform X3 [Archocentrus centrarchus]